MKSKKADTPDDAPPFFNFAPPFISLDVLPNILNIKRLRRSALLRTPFRRKLAVTAALVVLGCLVSPTVRYFVVSVVEFPIHYKEYREFGIRLPTGYRVHGIDVSRWQSRMDWGRVRAMKVGNVRLEFCFIKASEGGFSKDREFDRNWTAARKNGLVRGAYHYFKPAHSPTLQAWNFKRTVSLQKGDLPPVLDIEEDGGMNRDDLLKNAKIWLDEIEGRYGIRPIIYTNKDFYLKYFYKEPRFDRYKLWIAHFRVNDLELPREVKWQFWQHSDSGNVNGTNENVDFNVFNGDSAALRKLCL